MPRARPSDGTSVPAMMHPTLACGPWIDPQDPRFWVPLVSYLLLKPLAYFAFIQAFRYRVSRSIPMTFRQAAGLALLRAGLGIVFFSAGAAVLLSVRSEMLLILSWVYLYVERLASWLIVGKWGAGLRGRRLVGWVISGTLINASFDFAAIAGLLAAWPYVAAIIAGLVAYIALLHTIGRRASLRARFTAPVCRSCN
jgi:hypothetical protein